MTRHPSDLLRTVVPLALRARSRDASVAEAAAGEAVRATMAWFLDDEAAERMRPHGFNPMAVERIVEVGCGRLGLDRDRASAAHSGAKGLAEGLRAAVTGRLHVWGGARPLPLGDEDVTYHLRCGILALVGAAAFTATGDPAAAARAHDAAMGRELDADALAEAVGVIVGHAPLTMDRDRR